MSNTAEVNEKIATLVVELFTEGLQRDFRFASPEQLGYTVEELSTVKQRIRETVLDSLSYPTSIDEDTDAKAPFTRGYIHTSTYMSDTLERALFYIDGSRSIDKWWPLIPQLHVLVQNNRVYLITGDLKKIWVGGEDESDASSAELNSDVAKWSAGEAEGSVPAKVTKVINPPIEPNRKFRKSYAIPGWASDLRIGQKFSLTENGYAYEVLQLTESPYSHYVIVSVVAKKWRKVTKSNQRVGNSFRTIKENTTLENKTKERKLYLAEDRRIYLR